MGKQTFDSTPHATHRKYSPGPLNAYTGGANLRRNMRQNSSDSEVRTDF